MKLMVMESLQYYWQQRDRLIDLWGTANIEERKSLLQQIMKLDDRIESFAQRNE
jgi:hypothetical protein